MTIRLQKPTTLDRAVDKAYGHKDTHSDPDRIAFLFALYEKIIQDLGMATVSKIITKDSEGKYRRLFKIEGDKPDDASIYITLANKNGHHSYHGSVKDGLVQTHLSDIKSVSTQFQIPLSERKRAFWYINRSPCADRLPYTNKETKDILVTIKPEFLHYCSYLFYTDDSGLKEFTGQKSFVVLHKYQIPTRYAGELNFAVMIHESLLTQIQKKQIPA